MKFETYFELIHMGPLVDIVFKYRQEIIKKFSSTSLGRRRNRCQTSFQIRWASSSDFSAIPCSLPHANDCFSVRWIEVNLGKVLISQNTILSEGTVAKSIFSNHNKTQIIKNEIIYRCINGRVDGIFG